MRLTLGRHVTAEVGEEVTRPKARVPAIDAARAVAVLGMIVVNVGPRSGDGLGDVLHRLPLGRASLLFVVLAGVGITLLTRRARLGSARLPWATLLWRSGLLLVGGLALQLLDHGVSVILSTYAVLFVLAMPLVRVPDRSLLASALAANFLGPLLWISLQVISGVTYEASPATLTDSPWEILFRTAVSGPYPVIIWLGPFLIGMWLGRQDLGSRALQIRMVVFGAVAAIGGRALSVALIAWFSEPSDTVGFDRLVTSVAHSQMPLWLLSSTGSAVLVLGVMLWADRFVDRWLFPVVAAGRLALSIYVLHLVVLALVVRPGPGDVATGWLVSLAIAVVAVVFASVWRRFVGQGPLEALLRPPWTPGISEQRQLRRAGRDDLTSPVRPLGPVGECPSLVPGPPAGRPAGPVDSMKVR